MGKKTPKLSSKERAILSAMIRGCQLTHSWRGNVTLYSDRGRESFNSNVAEGLVDKGYLQSVENVSKYNNYKFYLLTREGRECKP